MVCFLHKFPTGAHFWTYAPWLFYPAKITSLFTQIWVLAAWKDLSFVVTIGLPDLSCCLYIVLRVSRITWLFYNFWYITVTLGCSGHWLCSPVSVGIFIFSSQLIWAMVNFFNKVFKHFSCAQIALRNTPPLEFHWTLYIHIWRVNVAKTIAISKLTFVCSVLNTPDTFANLVNKVIFDMYRSTKIQRSKTLLWLRWLDWIFQ